MTDLIPVPELTPVPQLEVKTLALGGTGNPVNLQAQALLNRFAFLSDINASNFIFSDTQIDVPSPGIPSISAAMDYLRGFTIGGNATVTVKVADGVYELTQVNLNHEQGGRIRVIGNELDGSLCSLKVTSAPTFDGFIASGGHAVGYVNGFSFDLPIKATSANNTTAILAVSGATINCGPQILVNNWYYGIAARSAGYISCDYAKVSNAGDVGIWAFNGGTVKCRFAQVSGVSDSENGLGFGIQGEYGGSVECEGASATACLVAGIAALSGSNVRAYNTNSSGNIGSGFYARDEGAIVAHGATTTGNAGYGIARIGSGTVTGNGIINNTNTLGNNSPAAVLDNNFSTGARLVALAGSLRLDVQEAASIFFNGPGGAQFEIGHTASAVNRVRTLASAAGSAPSISAVGTDPNVPLRLTSKGASDIEASNGNVRILTIGKGLRVAEGSNAKLGVATLVGGSVVVSNTSVTATSRIFPASQQDGGTPGWLRISARTVGVSFTITSSSPTDTSVVAYSIIEPA